MNLSSTRRRKKKSAASPPAGRPRRPRSAHRRAWTRRLAWTLGSALLVLSLGLGFLAFVYPARPGPGGGREVELVVLGDESGAALGRRLEAAGLVRSPGLFAAYWMLRRGHAARGAHLLTDDLPARELANRLERRGRASRVRVTVPEGFTRFDIARRLHGARVCTQREFLDATSMPSLLDAIGIPGPTAEGFLFPATYEFEADSDPAALVRRFKQEFDRRWEALRRRQPEGENALETTLGWGRREIVTLASMIEKEAAVDDERPIIASVFLNRLRDPAFKPKLLQCDPTAGYGCLVFPELSACAEYRGRITHAMNADAQNPFSTYAHEGLPPGPIANPGEASLEAVLAPAKTRFLYFVARGAGRHTFSENYEAHVSAVRRETSTP